MGIMENHYFLNTLSILSNGESLFYNRKSVFQY